MYEELNRTELLNTILLPSIPYNTMRYRLMQLIRTNVFKTNRNREFILYSFDNFLAGLGVRRLSPDYVVLRNAYPLIKILHDVKPDLLQFAHENNFEIRDLAKLFECAPGQIWNRPELLKSMQVLVKYYLTKNKAA